MISDLRNGSRLTALVVSAVLVLGGAPPASSQEADLLVRGREVFVRPGVRLENAAVLVQGGRIVAVGTDLAAPPGTREIEGALVCAGFVDPWSVLGLEPGSAGDGSTGAATRTVDGLDPYSDPHLRREVLRAGVTAVRAQAGSRSRIGGVGAVLRTHPEAAELVLLEDACVAASLGVTRDGRRSDVFDRLLELDRLLASLDAAQAHARKLAQYERELAEWEEAIREKEEELEEGFKKAAKEREKEIAEAAEKGEEHEEKRYKEDRRPRAPKPDPDAEVLMRVVGGELPLVVEVHRAEEVRELLDGTERFDHLRLVLAGATEALPYAEVLAERSVPVIVWPAPAGALELDEYHEHRAELAAELDRAGVEILIGSGASSPGSSADLALLAAHAVGHGLERDVALGAITLGAARALDLADRLGSIEAGKEAELVVLDGDPLASATRVLYVVSGGRVVVEP